VALGLDAAAAAMPGLQRGLEEVVRVCERPSVILQRMPATLGARLPASVPILIGLPPLGLYAGCGLTAGVGHRPPDQHNAPSFERAGRVNWR
jgi:hypothetical protein